MCHADYFGIDARSHIYSLLEAVVQQIGKIWSFIPKKKKRNIWPKGGGKSRNFWRKREAVGGGGAALFRGKMRCVFNAKSAAAPTTTQSISPAKLPNLAHISCQLHFYNPA